MNAKQLIRRIEHGDEPRRADAWQNAGPVGTDALDPLADLMAREEFHIRRAAVRAMWKIVRHAGRPGAEALRAETERALLMLLRQERPRSVRAEILWMLSEIGGDDTVGVAAVLLKSEQLREDARMVLERIEGEKSLAALKRALDTAPENFRLQIAQSLRRRGEVVNGFPCQKLEPSRQTKVRPVGR